MTLSNCLAPWESKLSCYGISWLRRPSVCSPREPWVWSYNPLSLIFPLILNTHHPPNIRYSQYIMIYHNGEFSIRCVGGLISGGRDFGLRGVIGVWGQIVWELSNDVKRNPETPNPKLPLHSCRSDWDQFAGAAAKFCNSFYSALLNLRLFSWGFPKIQGSLFWGLYIKDYCIQGYCLGLTA